MNIRTMVNAPDSLSRPSWSTGLWHLLRRGWKGLSLLTQFMILLTVTMVFISAISNKAIKEVAARSLVETSLEVEQAMARSVVLPVLGQEAISGSLDPEMENMLRNVVDRHLNPRYINKIKLWGVNGHLLFDSEMDEVPNVTLDPTAIPALHGETVVSISDADRRENSTDSVGGDLIYEVYMPLYALNGTLIAVLEAYCSSDLLAARIQFTLQKIDQIRFGVLLLGMLMLTALVFYAQRHIQFQEKQLLASIEATERLAQRNRELLEQSEDLRRRSAVANEQLLNHIGAELHDGPIQLLSIAALYRGQADVEQVDNPLQEKAQQLFHKALNELRNISIGLILPELEGASLREAVIKAVDAAKQDWDMAVELELPRNDCNLPLPHLVVAYRVVHEALTNAWKHGGQSVGKVRLSIKETQFEIKIFNVAKDDDFVAEQIPSDEPPHSGLGMIGMQKRVQAVGGTLAVQHTQGGVLVHLIAPMVET